MVGWVLSHCSTQRLLWEKLPDATAHNARAHGAHCPPKYDHTILSISLVWDAPDLLTYGSTPLITSQSCSLHRLSLASAALMITPSAFFFFLTNSEFPLSVETSLKKLHFLNKLKNEYCWRCVDLQMHVTCSMSPKKTLHVLQPLLIPFLLGRTTNTKLFRNNVSCCLLGCVGFILALVETIFGGRMWGWWGNGQIGGSWVIVFFFGVGGEYHMLSPACSSHANGSQRFNTFWQCVSWARLLVLCEGVSVLTCACACVCVCVLCVEAHYTVAFSYSSSPITPFSYSHLVLSVHCAKFPWSHYI